jgi:hypothetical protein
MYPRTPLLLGALALLAACADGPTTPDRAAPPSGPTRTVSDDAVGASIDVPADWRVHSDAVLFNTYGFVLFDPAGPKMGGHERSPVMRVALAYGARPADVEGLVAKLMERNAPLSPVRSEVEVGGERGIAVSGLPGTDPYSLVYVTTGERVYRIGVWTAERGLDDRARGLLAGLRLREPTREVRSLGLMPVEQAIRAEPPPEQAALNRAAREDRVRLVAAEGGDDTPRFSAEPSAPQQVTTAAACAYTQPSDLLWQQPWDATNRFYSGYTTSYSGTYYNLRPGDPGWSAMSGNYGSWWGQNFHVRCDYTGLLNQYFANDWPAHRNANVYSSIVGTVEWAGMDYQDAEGYYTLGNYVVVRNGGYRSLVAHLTSIAPGIRWGASVGINTVVGYAGRTGGPWDEHVHARVAYGESLTYMGQPYGGHSVKPTRLRCFSCRKTDPGATDGYADGQYDVINANGAKFYTRFYHGRWMRN